jgi:hypothetical protein
MTIRAIECLHPRRLWFAFAMVSIATHVGAAQHAPPDGEVAPLSGPAVAFVNGRWFDGTTFVRGAKYSVNGYFIAARPSHVDTTIDLGGGYVVPPLADAHNHNVEFFGEARAQTLLARYIHDGVFYDQNPNNLPRVRAGLAGMVNVPDGVDVRWSNGGLTGTGGHPTGLFRRNLAAGIFTPEDGDGGLLWYIDSLPDLVQKWPKILAQHPDFIKTFLLYSEEYARRQNDTAYFNWRGLDPKLLPAIVQRAHAAGLRVMAHVETAEDFHVAVSAGVDEIGHMPGFRGNEKGRLPDPGRYVIRDSDAAVAGRRGVPVVTTLQLGAGSYAPDGPDSLERRRFDALHRRNLRTLRRFHVPVAIGSDNYRTTSVPEALYLAQLGVFDNAELLRLWSVVTPQVIFPGRRIGRLQPGYETSFLLLDGDPTADFTNTQRIRLRVKQGRIIQPPGPTG